MDNFVHNLIKIKYINSGYLPNYPYHLISDVEMCDAFLNDENKTGYFYDNYTLIDTSLTSEYRSLVNGIIYYIDLLKSSKDAVTKLPNWVYSYMLGKVISDTSPVEDRHDLLVLMGLDNTDDLFTLEIAKSCLTYSAAWLAKQPSEKKGARVPTMFGEPHVIKYLRLMEVGVNS